MPISIKTVNKVLILTWENEDQTTAASWRIPSNATDEVKLRLLQKAVGFMELQVNSAVRVAPTVERLTSTATQLPATTDSLAQPTTAMRIPMLAPEALGDKASDGGPPKGTTDEKFWQGMPTVVTQQLGADPTHGWEMDPDAGAGW